MNRGDTGRAFATIVVFLVVLVTSSCAVPLAPGYKAVRETRTIRFVAGQPSTLRIQEQFSLDNSGTTALPYIDVDLPEPAVGAKNLRVELDGHAAGLSELPSEYRPDHPNTRRLTFERPWERGGTHQLRIDYTLSSPAESTSRIAIGEETFHLGSLGWAVLPQPPKHLLSPYPARPPKMSYWVVVPPGYLVAARGKMTGRKRLSSETEYVFQLRKNNLAPFVVGGHYIETSVGQGSASVVFWTLHPLRENPGTTPERLSSAWNTLENDFGPVDAMTRAPRVVESPNLTSPVTGAGPAAASFPGGALVNEDALALGIASDAFVERVSHALAYNWFRDQMYPTGAAALAMGEGLPEYATIVTDEAANGRAAREKRIEYYLQRYKDAVKQTPEKPLGVTMLIDPPAQRAIALAKAPLMYVALEDSCGEQPVRNGLKDLVTLLRGQEVGFDDMRSALEQTCGKDLGRFFREWLYGKGLPAGFQARYEPIANAAGR